MKKIVLIILSFICIACYAETHLSFLGTQIDGTLSSFQKIIAAKGFTNDQEETKVSPLGQKVYKGLYRGRKASLRVFYNRKSEVIYKVEVYVSSFEIPIMKDYLKKSISSIEASYKYNSDHHLEEEDGFLYQYEVLENDGKSVLGYIIVKGRQNYIYKPDIKKHGGFEITYTYIDRKNKELLTPISYEPRYGGGGLDENRFYNNFTWANGYYKNGCFPDYIDRMLMLLDHYKYQRGIPDIMKDKEIEFESKIIKAQSFCIARVPTGYSDRVTDDYLLTKENNPSEFEGLICKVSGSYFRLDKDCIKSHLNSYKHLLQIYKYRIFNLSEKAKYSDKEMLSVKLPVYRGDESHGTFGNIKWQYKILNVGLEYNLFLDCLELKVQDDYSPVFTYRSEKEIQLYIEVLEYACKYFNITI